jgi:hypothetical protein
MSQQPVIPAAEIFYRPRLDSLVPTQKINIKRRDGTVPVNNLRYFCGRPICDNCGAENPDSRVHSVQTRDIFVRFSTGESCFVQAMDLDLHRALGPAWSCQQPGHATTLAGLSGRHACPAS